LKEDSTVMRRESSLQLTQDRNSSTLIADILNYHHNPTLMLYTQWLHIQNYSQYFILTLHQ